jgi:hypothetical protein
MRPFDMPCLGTIFGVVNTKALQTIINYHIIESSVMAQMLEDGQSIETSADGQPPLKVTVDDGEISFTPPAAPSSISEANVIKPDIDVSACHHLCGDIYAAILDALLKTFSNMLCSTTGVQLNCARHRHSARCVVSGIFIEHG